MCAVVGASLVQVGISRRNCISALRSRNRLTMSQNRNMAVVDIDDTLLLGGRASRFFWYLSLLFQRMGRRLQRANLTQISQLQVYDRIVILSGRDIKELRFTLKQLKKRGIKFDRLVCCPRKELINNWKTSMVQELSRGTATVWIDDIFEDRLDVTSVTFSSNVKTRAPAYQKATKIRSLGSSELEWL